MRIRIWDEGDYSYYELGEDMVIATFHGRHITGQYVNLRTCEKNWLDLAPGVKRMTRRQILGAQERS